MGIIDTFFGTDGRLSKSKYAWRILVFPLLAALPFFLVLTILIENNAAIYPYWIPLPIAFFLCVISLSIRRLHDRGKSGWWVLLYFLVGPVLAGSAEYFPNPFRQISLILGAGIEISGIIEFGLLSGDKRGNKYGPPNDISDAIR